MHTCKQCGKGEPEVRFVIQGGGSFKLRPLCNLCRNAQDRARKAARSQPRNYFGWMNLCADSRTDWTSL